MAQIVFLHGPGAGACADAFHHQRRYFPKSVALSGAGHFPLTEIPDTVNALIEEFVAALEGR